MWIDRYINSIYKQQLNKSTSRSNKYTAQCLDLSQRISIIIGRTMIARRRSQLSTFMYSYRAYGGGGGHDASVLFLNVDILLMLPPGGYD